jgi:L-2,4-diaminobutyrate decarboxylase
LSLTPDILPHLEADFSPEAGRLFVDLIARYTARARAGHGPVSSWLGPTELAARFAEPLPRNPRPLAEVAARLEGDIVAGANRLLHPMYLGHQVPPPLPAAAWADAVISAVNNSLPVAEMSPTATAVERQVVRWMCQLVGWGETSGGAFTSGGTEATFTALLAARASLLPDAWEHGVGVERPAVVYGEQAHYAVTRAIGMLGLGLSAGIPVPTRNHRTDPGALDDVLQRLSSQGRRVMAVVATAGSTPTGAFDDLELIGEICDAHQVWLHVDAAHGGSALFSARHRDRLRGIARARSVAWDPHKLMLVPAGAGVVLTRQEQDLDHAFSQRAPYLFHPRGAGERTVDQGVRSFQCTRRADAVKVWVALQRYGADGMGAIYDRLCALTRTLYRLTSERPEFIPLHEPEGNILCFRWVGGAGLTEAARDELNRTLRERYNASGRGWITSTVLEGRRVLRVTLMNPFTEERHLGALLDGLVAEAALLLRDPQASI